MVEKNLNAVFRVSVKTTFFALFSEKLPLSLASFDYPEQWVYFHYDLKTQSFSSIFFESNVDFVLIKYEVWIIVNMLTLAAKTIWKKEVKYYALSQFWASKFRKYKAINSICSLDFACILTLVAYIAIGKI